MLPIRHFSPPSIGASVCGGALAAALVVAVLWKGGFGAWPQDVYVALAGAALLLTAWLNPRAMLLALQSRLPMTLGVLAALSVASLAWTIGEPEAALRSGLVVGADGAMFIAASALTQARGVRPLMMGIVGLAAVEVVIGLRGVALHASPDAELIGGSWRPGGTFEYPPALAALQVSAISILSHFLQRRSSWVAALGAGLAFLAGAVIGLAESRLAIAAGTVLLLVLIVKPQLARTSRAAATATAMAIVLGLLVGRALLEEPATGRAPGIAALAAVFAVAVLIAGAWLLVRRTLTLHVRRNMSWWGAPIACVTALAIIAAAGLRGPTAVLCVSARLEQEACTRSRSALLHGRGNEWTAALQTWLDRPLLGGGAGTYYQASLVHQSTTPTLYAHDLPLELAAELGVGGLVLVVLLYVDTARLILTTRPDSMAVLLAPAVAMFLASNIVDWTWHLVGLAAIWAVAAGGLHASSVSARASAQVGARRAAQLAP